MHRHNTVAVAVAAILASAMQAREAAAQDTSATEDLQEVVVTGLRASLTNAMDIKRNAIGIVDAINAEDIGKFPDANLSESLQRITGISISRRNGEGALVTARGFGSEFNMVTLNGRMMPAADAFAGGNTIDGGVSGQNAVVQLRQSRVREHQRASRCTRPARPTSPRAASAPRSTS